MFTICPAQLKDIDAISKLNKKWLTHNINIIDTSNGFLFGDAFTTKDLEKIILHKEIIVAKLNNNIIGYYLLDNFSKSQILQEHKILVSEFLLSNSKYKNLNISLRMQCVVDLQYQMQGLSKQMFHLLLKQINKKYNLLFATASKANPKIAAHTSSGWKVLSDTDSLMLLIYMT